MQVRDARMADEQTGQAIRLCQNTTYWYLYEWVNANAF